MAENDNPHITALLQRVGGGEREAFDRLAQAVYPELKRIAAGRLRRERLNHTLQPTALVNEAFARLLGSADISWQDRAHFYAVMARQMRFILVDYARRKQRRVRVAASLEDVAGGETLAAVRGDEDLIALDEALQRLALVDARAAQGVELKFFAGLTIEEIAAIQQVNAATVKRDWVFAKSWLYAQLTFACAPQP